DGMRDRNAAIAEESLAILRELGPQAASALPAVIKLLDVEPRDRVSMDLIVVTLAELLPFRGRDSDIAAAAPATDICQRIMAGNRGVGRVSPLERLRFRAEFPLDLELQDLIASTRACRAYRIEVAVDLLGARGAEARQAVPVLQQLLARRDPLVLETDGTV